MPHLDIVPGDLVTIREGKNAGRVGVVITSIYKEYKTGWFKRDPSLTYCIKDPGSNKTIYTTGGNLALFENHNEDITVYVW